MAYVLSRYAMNHTRFSAATQALLDRGPGGGCVLPAEPPQVTRSRSPRRLRVHQARHLRAVWLKSRDAVRRLSAGGRSAYSGGRPLLPALPARSAQAAAASEGEAQPTPAGVPAGRAPAVADGGDVPRRLSVAHREAYRTGDASLCDDEARDEEVMGIAATATFAPGSMRTRRAHLAWWVRRAFVRRLAPYPLSVRLLQLAAALLKSGGYRSGPHYLGSLKAEHVRLGFAWNEALSQVMRNGVRACRRGLGPPRRAAPAPLAALCARCFNDPPNVIEVPNAIIGVTVGTWWCLREAELANANLSDITFAAAPAVPCGRSVALALPASKGDQAGAGCVRLHACSCPAAGCPVRLLTSLVAVTTAMREAMGSEGEHPLLPTAAGGRMTKAVGSAAVRRVVAEVAPDLVGITGHSMRTGGAQALAAAGIPRWEVMAFGRWRSEAVLGYVRGAQLNAAAPISCRVARG